MFGGGNENLLPHLLTGENQPKYNANSSTQLQLFKLVPSGIDPFSATNPVAEGMHLQSSGKGHKERDGKISPEEAKKLLNAVRPSSNPVSTGLRLSYDDDEHNSSITSTSCGISSLPMSLFFDESLKNELENQRDEIEKIVRAQEEQLMKNIRELKLRHLKSFVSVLEDELTKKLRQKEAEIENMNRRNRELVDKLSQASMEAESWRHRARFNESVVTILKNNIMQAIAQGKIQGIEGCGDSKTDDVASSNGNSPAIAIRRMICRACRAGTISALLLPCRHLCLCKDCGDSVTICPICHTVKSVSVPVSMS